MTRSQFSRRAFSRWPLAAIATLGLTASLGVLSAPAAQASTTTAAAAEARFLSHLNGARTAAGLRPYIVGSHLVRVARQHSAAMASGQRLYHNPDLTSDIVNWQAVGENVGEGPTEPDVHSAFMHSPEHRANILDRDFTRIGIGVTIDKQGVVWVTEDFRQPAL